METVLIVEDDRVYARTTANWLVKNGINARYVLSVDAAKVFLESHEVDLVLSDFRLNDSNGVELLEWMKAPGLLYAFPYHDRLRGYTRCGGSGEERCRRLSAQNPCRRKRCSVSSVDCWTVETERKLRNGLSTSARVLWR